MYIRFLVGADAENPAWLNGVFVEARMLLDGGVLDRHESAYLDATFAWFNEHLPCPPFRRKLRSGEWTRDAVAWFRPGAKGPIARIWDLVAILKEHDVSARMITSRRPGKIVYGDDFQIVAETPYWA